MYIDNKFFIRPHILLCDLTEGGAAETEEKLSREDAVIYRMGREMEFTLKNRIISGIDMIIIRDGGYENNGFYLLEELRLFSDIPAAVVSDDGGEMYCVMALAKGADICVGSNMPSFEFRARLQSLLRRYLGTSERIQMIRDSTIVNGEIVVDRVARAVYFRNRYIHLTAIEYGIVAYLMQRIGTVCSIEEIYSRVWNSSPIAVKKTVAEYIRRIRRKIEPDPENPVYIKAVFGTGYIMERVRQTEHLAIPHTPTAV